MITGELSRFRSNRAEQVALAVGLGVAMSAGLADGLGTASAALCAAAVALLIWRRPILGVLIAIGIIYLLPYGTSPLRLGDLHPTLLDLTLTATLAAWSVPALVRAHRPSALPPLAIAVGVFVAALSIAFLAGLAATVPEHTQAFLKLLNSVLLLLTVLYVVRTPDYLLWSIRALLLGAGVAAPIALALHFLPLETSHGALAGLSSWGYPSDDTVIRFIAGSETRRATGTAVDPNLLAGALAVTLPLAIGQLLEPRGVLPRWMLAVIAVLGGTALLFTYSRTAWGATVLGLAFLAVVRYRRIWLLLAAGAAAVLLSPLRDRVWDRLASGLLWSDPAAGMRIGEYRAAVVNIVESPLLGIGFGTPEGVDPLLRVSSMYLLLTEQAGLLGLGCFLAVLAVLGLTMWQARDRLAKHTPSGLHLSLLGALVVALAIGLFDHYFFNYGFPHMVALFWLLLGLLGGISRLETGAIIRE